MKKTTILSTAIILAGFSLTFTSCKKDNADTTNPVISVVGANPYYLQKGTTWADPGATATDDVDGTIVATPTGTVTTTSVGSYTITYTSKDKADNTTTETRTVNVVDINGVYAATDVSPFPGGTSSGYSETMSMSSDGSGKVNLTKFGDYVSGSVYFNLTSLNTLSVPSQTVTCGSPSAVRTFTGTGSISATAPQVTILFSEYTGGTTINSEDTYTK